MGHSDPIVGVISTAGLFFFFSGASPLILFCFRMIQNLLAEKASDRTRTGAAMYRIEILVLVTFSSILAGVYNGF